MIVNKFKEHGKSWIYAEYKDMEYKLYAEDLSEEYVATKQFSNDLILKISCGGNISKTIIPDAWDRFVNDYAYIDFKSYIRYWFQTSIYEGYESLNPITAKMDKDMTKNKITESDQFRGSIEKSIFDDYIKDDIIEARGIDRTFYDKKLKSTKHIYEIIDISEKDNDHSVLFIFDFNGKMKKCMWFDEDSIDIYNKLVNDPVNFKKVIKEFNDSEETIKKCKKFIALALVGKITTE